MAEIECERKEDLSSEGKRECLVLRSQESLRKSSQNSIPDEEAHLGLYSGVRNVTIGLHSLYHGQFCSSMGESYAH